jgi:hypothetical protein
MKKTMLLAATLLFAAALTLSLSAAVGEQGRGRAQTKKSAKVDKADDGFVFDRAGHVRAIHDYVRAGSLPLALLRPQSVAPPPGRKTRKDWIGVPGDLVARMPPMPPYYHRYFAGDDLIVVDTRNNTIAFLIRDVLGRTGQR